MLKKWLGIVLCIFLVTAAAPVTFARTPEGTGSRYDHYIVTDAEQLETLLEQTGTEKMYIRLDSDIFIDRNDLFANIHVQGKKVIDLGGHTLHSKLPFGDILSDYVMFYVPAGAFLTVDDSVGGGEIIFDRYIPNMGEVNEQTGVFLDRPLSVFDVRGTLTVNGGEITAGHYESEYYTYTDGFHYVNSSPSPGTVNSITIGNAVVVGAGGVFFASGGEFYGRGFVMDEDGEGFKGTACAAVVLKDFASATIYAGDFYGKSCADVFSVSSRADLTVCTGGFHAKYDNRITVDKINGVATYLNVDCGRIGIPLRAFDDVDMSLTHIYIDSVEYNYSASYDDAENALFTDLGKTGTGTSVTVETVKGNGSEASPYRLEKAEDVRELFGQDGLSKVYIRLENDIDECPAEVSVTGNIVFDLNGHTIKDKLAYGANLTDYALFIVEKGSSLTVDDSVGGGEIQFDRRIPTMGEMNEQTEILLARPLNVILVKGTLTVNAGEFTAGHYESEYYTYTKKYNTGGGTSADTVNSVTPGNCVVVKDGGRFTANGGEFYGRGFTIDDNGEKLETCAAVRLENGAAAIVNAGDFYGKSCADVFCVAWGANAYINFGYFEAQYDNRITVDKLNGTAYYVNVDCGRIGLPLRSFTHTGADRRVIKIGPDPYPFSLDFTTSQSDEFENLGSEGIGADITVSVRENGTSRIVREDGVDAGLTYSPTDHFELIHENAQYYSESFAPLPAAPYHVMNYYWKVTRLGADGWEDVGYTPDAPVSDNYYTTDTNRLDLYDLARALRGGMTAGSTYRVEARASEYWRPAAEIIYTVSDDVIEIDCVPERIGSIDLPDSVTGIVWPEHGKSPVNVSVEQEKFTASLSFEERASGGTRYVAMSERSTFARGGSYRLKVQITPKRYYRADAGDTVTVGGKAATDLAVSGTVLTGYIVPLDVLPSKIASVPLRGDLAEGTEITAYSPLNVPISGVTISQTWYKDGAVYTGTATKGEYRARVTVTTQDPYVFTAATKVKIMGKVYTITSLSSDGLSGEILTDPVVISCSHSANTNKYSYDENEHFMICSVCGDEIERGSHTMGSWQQRYGENVRKCTVCDYEETESNGKQGVPYIRLAGGLPMAGSKVPTLTVCTADDKYAEIEGVVEWFKDELEYTGAIPDDTVMEEGSVYYAQVKMHPKSGYYFADDATITTLNPQASSIETQYVSQNFGETILKFVPRAYAAARYTLGTLEGGKTFRAFLSEIQTSVDGVSVPYLAAIYKNGSYIAGVSYTPETDSWWIASGDVDAFLDSAIESDCDYKLGITVYESGKYFTEEAVTVTNPAVADTVEIAAGDASCTVSVSYNANPLSFYGASLTLQNNLKVNFFVEKAPLVSGGYTGLSASFTMNGETVPVTTYTESTVDAVEYYVFSFRNVSPDRMNDRVTATLHATKNGTAYTGSPLTYSVKQYCYSQLEKTDDAKLRTLLVDLLNYGAASQLYTDYKTTDLVNADLTAAQRAWGTASDPVLSTVKNTEYRTVESPAVTWEGVFLKLGQSVTMQFVLSAASLDGISIRIEAEDGSRLATIPASAFEPYDIYYIASFGGLLASQMSDTVYVTAYDGDNAVSDTVAYSIESYAFAKQNAADEALANLVKAMMKYGNAARAYAS